MKQFKNKQTNVQPIFSSHGTMRIKIDMKKDYLLGSSIWNSGVQGFVSKIK